MSACATPRPKREAEGFLAFPLAPSPATPPAQTGRRERPDGHAVLPADSGQRRGSAASATARSRPNTAKLTYDYWLPSLNVKVALPNKVQLRFGLSKTLTPPDIGLTRNYYNVTLDSSDAALLSGPLRGATTVGNPYLKPTTSFNVDFSAEWYFAPVGSLTFAVFNKEPEGRPDQRIVKVPFTNNGRPSTCGSPPRSTRTRPATVRGFELGYQQFYDFLPKPFDGFGINANYSFIDSKGVPQSTLSSPIRTSAPAASPRSTPACRCRACPSTTPTSRPSTRRARFPPVWPTTGARTSC
jgi:TonB-dependent receptor